MLGRQAWVIIPRPHSSLAIGLDTSKPLVLVLKPMRGPLYFPNPACPLDTHPFLLYYNLTGSKGPGPDFRPEGGEEVADIVV